MISNTCLNGIVFFAIKHGLFWASSRKFPSLRRGQQAARSYVSSACPKVVLEVSINQ